MIKRSILTIPTFLYVSDIYGIVKRSGLNNGKDFIFTNSNVPPQIPTILYVTDICRIVKRSGLNDGSNFIKFDKTGRRWLFRPCGNVPSQIPTMLYVTDICGIVKRSGLNDRWILHYCNTKRSCDKILKFNHSFSVYQNFIEIAVQHIVKKSKQ